MKIDKYKDIVDLTEKEINTLESAKAKVKLNIPLVVVASISFLAFTLSVKTDPLFGIVSFSFPAIIILIASSVGIGVLYSKASKAYSLVVKEIVIKKIFESAFDTINYQPNKGFEESYIGGLEMYERGNRYNSEDLLMGSYKGVGFSQADVDIKTVTSNGKTTTTVTNFKGRFIICDFFKDFEGYHQIRSNHSFFANKKPGRFFGSRSAKEINFESNEFNKQFTCYTNNEQEAFYLITPNYMEVMSTLAKELNCEVVFGFIDHKLHIAIYNNEDAFEVSDNKINDIFVNRILKEAELIKYVIDGLQLDLDIFK